MKHGQPESVSEAWAINKHNVRGDTMNTKERAGAYETAVEGYALALRLRSETDFHPLRRAGDESVT